MPGPVQRLILRIKSPAMNKTNEPQTRACKWVSFDCYGTLVDWNKGFAAILKPIAREHIASLLQAYHRHEPQVETERPHRLYREVLTESLLRAAKEIGLSMSEAQARTLPERWGLLPVMNDAEEALAGLRSEGCQLAVLTNCDEELFGETQRSFRHPFDLVITAERVRSYKPSPGHFRCFEQTTGVNRADWIHVANSWFHDIAPARQMGINCIWLDREGTDKKVEADCVRVRSGGELLQAIRRTQTL